MDGATVDILEESLGHNIPKGFPDWALMSHPVLVLKSSEKRQHCNAPWCDD